MAMPTEFTVKCKACGEPTIVFAEVARNRVVKRGFTGKKGEYNVGGGAVLLTETCPSCGAKVRKNDFA